jgi:hypothetical protein
MKIVLTQFVTLDGVSQVARGDAAPLTCVK